MWSLLLALLCGAGLVAGAPTEQDGRSSSLLPVEHRKPHPGHVDVLGELFDVMFKSQTASAIDEAASRVASSFGGIIDNIGEFVVGTVKQIPGTIDMISKGVDDAMKNGEKAVVIVVKGLRDMHNMHNLTFLPVIPGNQTVEQVFTQFNRTKTATTLEDLDKTIRFNLGRIGGTVLANVDDIDKAIATSIRRVAGSNGSSSTAGTSQSNVGTPRPVITLDLLEDPIIASSDDSFPAAVDTENEGLVSYQSPFTDTSSSSPNGPNYVFLLSFFVITQLLSTGRQITRVR